MATALTPNTDLSDRPTGRLCFSAVTENKNIRALYQKEIITIPYIISYWNRLVENVPWKNVWSLPFKYMLTSLIK